MDYMSISLCLSQTIELHDVLIKSCFQSRASLCGQRNSISFTPLYAMPTTKALRAGFRFGVFAELSVELGVVFENTTMMPAV